VQKLFILFGHNIILLDDFILCNWFTLLYFHLWFHINPDFAFARLLRDVVNELFFIDEFDPILSDQYSESSNGLGWVFRLRIVLGLII
jgi:hypothetical protein